MVGKSKKVTLAGGVGVSRQPNLDFARARKVGTMNNLDTAKAFWSDAIRQFLKAANDPKTDLKTLAGFEAYYLRASRELRRAFESKEENYV